jgi:hypothetical protein
MRPYKNKENHMPPSTIFIVPKFDGGKPSASQLRTMGFRVSDAVQPAEEPDAPQGEEHGRELRPGKEAITGEGCMEADASSHADMSGVSGCERSELSGRASETPGQAKKPAAPDRRRRQRRAIDDE